MFIKVCALAIISSCSVILLFQVGVAFSTALKLAASVLVFGMIATYAEPIFSQLLSISNAEELSGYAEIVIKALGIAILSQITSQICRDCQNASVASGVELAAKFEIFILCLPLINEIIGYAVEILNMG